MLIQPTSSDDVVARAAELGGRVDSEKPRHCSQKLCTAMGARTPSGRLALIEAQRSNWTEAEQLARRVLYPEVTNMPGAERRSLPRYARSTKAQTGLPGAGVQSERCAGACAARFIYADQRKFERHCVAWIRRCDSTRPRLGAEGSRKDRFTETCTKGVRRALPSQRARLRPGCTLAGRNRIPVRGPAPRRDAEIPDGNSEFTHSRRPGGGSTVLSGGRVTRI
jgi:hypothetical protein